MSRWLENLILRIRGADNTSMMLINLHKLCVTSKRQGLDKSWVAEVVYRIYGGKIKRSETTKWVDVVWAHTGVPRKNYVKQILKAQKINKVY